MNRHDPRDEYVDKLRVELLGPVARSFEEVVWRVETIWEDPEREFVIQALYGFAMETIDPKSTLWYPKPVYTLLPENEDLLFRSLAKLIEAAEVLSSRERQSADRAISRLIRLLSNARAFEIVKPWFDDKRKFRQNVVVRAIRNAGVPDSYAQSIVQWYRDTLSEDAIKIIAENNNCLQLLTLKDVEKRLDVPDSNFSVGEYLVTDRENSYWKMRVIAAYLSLDRTVSDQIVCEHPREFLWAVGRTQSRSSLPQVRKLLCDYQNEPEYIWRILKTFKKAGTEDDVVLASSVALRVLESIEEGLRG